MDILYLVLLITLFIGAVLKAEKRIQLNLLLQKCKYLPEVEEIPNVMLPIFYGSEEGSISPDLANDFKSAVYTVKYGVTGGIWAAIGCAGQCSDYVQKVCAFIRKR